MQTFTPAPPGSFLKELRNFFCSKTGFAASLGGDCCGAAYVYFERFSGYRADVSCCTTKMYLISIIQTGRCGRICFVTLLLRNLNANMVICSCSLVVLRHCIIVNDLEITDKMYGV